MNSGLIHALRSPHLTLLEKFFIATLAANMQFLLYGATRVLSTFLFAFQVTDWFLLPDLIFLAISCAGITLYSATSFTMEREHQPLSFLLTCLIVSIYQWRIGVVVCLAAFVVLFEWTIYFGNDRLGYNLAYCNCVRMMSLAVGHGWLSLAVEVIIFTISAYKLYPKPSGLMETIAPWMLTLSLWQLHVRRSLLELGIYVVMMDCLQLILNKHIITLYHFCQSIILIFLGLFTPQCGHIFLMKFDLFEVYGDPSFSDEYHQFLDTHGLHLPPGTRRNRIELQVRPSPHTTNSPLHCQQHAVHTSCTPLNSP